MRSSKGARRRFVAACPRFDNCMRVTRPTAEGWTSNRRVGLGRARWHWSLFACLRIRSAEFLGESDEEPFRPTDVAEPIRVFILDYFAYELRAAIAEPFKRLVDVVHGEHDAEVAEGVDGGVPVICDNRRHEEAGRSSRPWPSGVRIMAISTR